MTYARSLSVGQRCFSATPDGIKRVSEYYINTECTKLLLEALVIEPGKKQQFFIQVCKKSNGAMVRLEPTSPVEKTVGVKRLMGQVAFAIRSLYPGSHYAKTNIAEHLPDNDGTKNSSRGGKKLRAVA